MTRPAEAGASLHHLLDRPDIAALDAGQGVMLRQGALEAGAGRLRAGGEDDLVGAEGLDVVGIERAC